MLQGAETGEPDPTQTSNTSPFYPLKRKENSSWEKRRCHEALLECYHNNVFIYPKRKQLKPLTHSEEQERGAESSLPRNGILTIFFFGEGG